MPGAWRGTTRAASGTAPSPARSRPLTSTGGLVGANEESGSIENCRVSGSVTGQHYTGGIAGQNLGSIVRCVSSASVNTTSQEFAADVSNLSLTELDSTTELINDYTDTGGIAGFSSGVVSACMNTGAVGYEHMGYNIGGIVGRQSGYVESCTNSGSILGRKGGRRHHRPDGAPPCAGPLRLLGGKPLQGADEAPRPAGRRAPERRGRLLQHNGAPEHGLRLHGQRLGRPGLYRGRNRRFC
ncbi:MAG: GLUG motif-containing protein [Lachnospiraceae bacterium]